MQVKLNTFFSAEHSSLLWARRPHASDESEEEQFLAQEQVAPLVQSGQLKRLDKELQDISSTEVRKSRKEGDKAKQLNLVCQGVLEYVEREDLYRD